MKVVIILLVLAIWFNIVFNKLNTKIDELNCHIRGLEKMYKNILKTIE